MLQQFTLSCSGDAALEDPTGASFDALIGPEIPWLPEFWNKEDEGVRGSRMSFRLGWMGAK